MVRYVRRACAAHNRLWRRCTEPSLSRTIGRTVATSHHRTNRTSEVRFGEGVGPPPATGPIWPAPGRVSGPGRVPRVHRVAAEGQRHPVSRTAVRCDDAGRHHQDDECHRHDPGQAPRADRARHALRHETVQGVRVPRGELRRGRIRQARQPGRGTRVESRPLNDSWQRYSVYSPYA